MSIRSFLILFFTIILVIGSFLWMDRSDPEPLVKKQDKTQLNANFFIKVRASDMHCQLTSSRAVFLDTNNYESDPLLTTFGYGIDAGEYLTLGDNILTLTATPLDMMKSTQNKERYCEIMLLGEASYKGKTISIEIPFNIAFDQAGNPYSIDKNEISYVTDLDEEPKNQISVIYREDNNESIKAVTLKKTLNLKF